MTVVVAAEVSFFYLIFKLVIYFSIYKNCNVEVTADLEINILLKIVDVSSAGILPADCDAIASILLFCL